MKKKLKIEIQERNYATKKLGGSLPIESAV
jgi:hypothetical protein